MKKFVVAALAALAPLWACSQLLIGQTAGFSGPVAAGVKETTSGAKLWIDKVNASGGVHGQRIELLSLDDKFEPPLAAANAKVLVEEKNVLAMFLNRGTPHTEALLPVLEANGVALVAPSTGAMLLHHPVRKTVFNVRSTYQREAEKAVSHLHTLGITRIAVVHADDSFGLDGLEGANKGFAKAGIEPVAVVKADRGKPDTPSIIPAITSKDAQAVLWIASGKGVAEGVKALRAAKSAAQVVTLSNNASGGFIQSLGKDAHGVIVTQVFPSVRSYAYVFVKEAAELAREKNLELSPQMLEGYVAAKVLVEGLRRAGPNPTRAKVVAALENIHKYDIGGLELNFGPDDHTGLDFADLSIIGADGKFKR
ncbi:ABC transporter substrate-binding protein [Ramlibacter alkalitolerans]|uniref:ABC transporter substrate-binding protein n=1 Tax=Ramlibacter alkalitolerans TaxID=2039631 RepID=A0ABS1JQV5_9BURK|nr:ABC transporter substrate-binding protein [Ramlibacter alkalitolerans]MBL0426531.1 ABC transporter substrate-binding protein [Ramlibacter alkalitolerans]